LRFASGCPQRNPIRDDGYCHLGERSFVLYGDPLAVMKSAVTFWTSMSSQEVSLSQGRWCCRACATLRSGA